MGGHGTLAGTAGFRLPVWIFRSNETVSPCADEVGLSSAAAGVGAVAVGGTAAAGYCTGAGIVAAAMSIETATGRLALAEPGDTGLATRVA